MRPITLIGLLSLLLSCSGQTADKSTIDTGLLTLVQTESQDSARHVLETVDLYLVTLQRGDVEVARSLLFQAGDSCRGGYITNKLTTDWLFVRSAENWTIRLEPITVGPLGGMADVYFDFPELDSHPWLGIPSINFHVLSMRGRDVSGVPDDAWRIVVEEC